MESGLAAMASWTSCARVRSASAPRSRAVAEMARARSTLYLTNQWHGIGIQRPLSIGVA
jgi:hypothetical protein